MARNGKFHLTALISHDYKLNHEESWWHERREVREPDRIWYELIPCKGDAFIGLYTLTPPIFQLSTSRVKNARLIWEKIKDHPDVKEDFHFDGEAILYFPLELVHIVAEMAGARKKRRLSEAHKAKLMEANLAYRFNPKFNASKDTETTQI